jgi:predicted TIM-barrel fold metal-dependent hydrolase
MIVDTHLHLIDRSALTYPWLSAVPALDQDFLYDHYALEAARSGIVSALHMEVDVNPVEIEAETGHVEALSRRPGSLIRGAIAACRPEEPGFAAYLERQTANPFVKGFRRVLHVVSEEIALSPLLRENLQRMQGSGLTFDLIVQPHHLPNAMALADLAPGLQFILNHCGSPDLKAGKGQSWWNHVAELAKRPNVVAKISGIIAYTDPDNWTVESLRPYVERTITSFGWNRVVWGSDWPVCNLGGGLSAWVAATHALIGGSSSDERDALLSGNARRIWGLA